MIFFFKLIFCHYYTPWFRKKKSLSSRLWNGMMMMKNSHHHSLLSIRKGTYNGLKFQMNELPSPLPSPHRSQVRCFGSSASNNHLESQWQKKLLLFCCVWLSMKMMMMMMINKINQQKKWKIKLKIKCNATNKIWKKKF